MLEETPSFNFTPPLRCIAGVRPYRTTGYRLQAQQLQGAPTKFVVHNYGHGGAGISLSWGFATKVRDMVQAHVASTSDRAVAVIGSGVMGLTAATLLLELGLRVTIYAEKFWAETTSRVAGGQWAPSVVLYSNESEFKELLETAYRKFEASIGHGFGVSRVPNYTIERNPSLDKVLELCPGLIPDVDVLANLPFEHLNSPGFRYHTLLIEPPIFLQRLDRDLRAANVPFVQRTFTDVASVRSLPETIIVNCTGYGARKLWEDDKVEPIKGELALIDPEPDLDYLFGRSGYLFPRADGVVIGGTFEIGDETTNADPARCQELVDNLKRIFGVGAEVGLAPVGQLPEFHIDHPKNLPYLAPRQVQGDEAAGS